MATVVTQDRTLMFDIPATAFTLDGFTQWVHSGDLPEKQKVSFLGGAIFIDTWWPPDELIGIHVPSEAQTLDGFSRWTYSDSFPERGRVTFSDGRLLIDMSPERFESHIKIKAEIDYAIMKIVKEGDLGEFYSDGGRIQNPSAKLSAEPDAVFALWETLESGRLSPPANKEDGTHTDLVGSPDWVCEVVSDSSVEKDTIVLQEKYHAADIREYWLIDARDDSEPIDFKLQVWSPRSYDPAAEKDGWQFSNVFGRWFKLTRCEGRLGHWRYDLQVRN